MNTKSVSKSKLALSTKESNNWRKVFATNNEKVFQQLVEYLGIEESEGMKKQVNRGKLAEMWVQKSLGLFPKFDRDTDYDFIHNFQKIQFKYLGQNSSPSCSEIVRREEESMVKFVNRIMKHYQSCQLFTLSFDNYISHINWEDCITITPKEFKVILRAHEKNVKIGNKLRLRKTVVKRCLQDMGKWEN